MNELEFATIDELNEVCKSNKYTINTFFDPLAEISVIYKDLSKQLEQYVSSPDRYTTKVYYNALVKKIIDAQHSVLELLIN